MAAAGDMTLALSIILPVVAYLLGSIPFGVVIARARGVDLRQVGSGNIGATNAARALGKASGAVVLLLDALKGFAPVLLARLLLARAPYGEWLLATTALGAFLGHLFPVFLGFRGGKGVATALGVFLALSPLAALGALVVYALVYAITRTSSLGSLTAAVAFVPLLYFLAGRSRVLLALAVLLVLMIILSHRENIRRLLRREEGKV
jgi:acyl phosphate:glycerol-3-phosphate acyltransferase